MLRIFRSTEDKLIEIDTLGSKGIWISLVAPTADELARVSREEGISKELLEYPLDSEEISRIEYDDDAVLIIVRIPVMRGEGHDTIPLGVVLTDAAVITVCLEPAPIIAELFTSPPRGFYTYKKTRFLLQLLFQVAVSYLRYLRQIDRKSDEIQTQLQQSTQNEELIRLLGLGKSLVYFSTSLRANEIVMEKLLKSHLGKEQETEAAHSYLIRMYSEDQELLEDVITENKQAIEMADIYTSILNSTMDAFASVISNNLNRVMKFLTAVTIVLMVPTMLSSFYGMNVRLPFEDAPHAFVGIMVVSVTLSMAVILILRRRRMF